MASVDITPIEVLALKKLALINGALAQSLENPIAKTEQTALLRVLMDVAARAERANAIPPAVKGMAARAEFLGLDGEDRSGECA